MDRVPGRGRVVKTALLHYWLTNVRGGEKVLFALGEMLPDADVFTHALAPEKWDQVDGKWRLGTTCHAVRESFIARLPWGRRHPQMYLPLMPAACRALRLDDYELIVSSESGPIKGIRKPSGARHVCYCHTPMRYVWDMYDEYYRHARGLAKLAMPLFVKYMRHADLKSAEAVDLFVANSRFVAERIQRIYGRDAVVVHPPVDVAFFEAAVAEDEAGYYLYSGQLVDYKRPDLAIAACVKFGRRIVVVGDGAGRARLEKQYAGNPLVEFRGRVSNEDLRKCYAGARALVFPGIEDFGIVPVEAQAAGCPVVALGIGGARETVLDGQTGLFFSEQTVDALVGALEEFEGRRVDWRTACRENARRFSSSRFCAEMRALLL